MGSLTIMFLGRGGEIQHLEPFLAMNSRKPEEDMAETGLEMNQVRL